MMAITLYLHFGLERRMLKLRDSIGVIDNVPVDDARRVEFNRMHDWSTSWKARCSCLGWGCCIWWCASRRLARGGIKRHIPQPPAGAPGCRAAILAELTWESRTPHPAPL